ncbi:hypothetical protein [Drancourtella sp. An12]|nr:hypothetical protein [Drancourtella sp. An12]
MHRYEYSDKIVNVVKQFLAEDNWPYDRPEVIRLNLFATKGGEA